MADTSVKIFDSSMTGAPTLNGPTAGAIIAMLDACLKDGFGLKSVDSIVVAAGLATVNISTGHSAKADVVMLIAGSGTAALNGEKRVISTTTTAFTFDATGVADGTYTGSVTAKVAPAGWTKHAGSAGNIAAYKSSNAQATGHWFRFDDTATATYDARWFGCETLTDINTWTGKFPTDTQQSGGLYMGRRSNNTGTSAWWVIADDRTVYIGIAYSNGLPNDYFVHAFGDYVSRKGNDQFKSFVCGSAAPQVGGTPNNTGTILLCNQTGSVGAYCARSYTAISGAVPIQGKFNTTSTGNPSGGSGFPFPNPVDNALLFDNIGVIETQAGNAMRGKLPGVLANLQVTVGQISDGAVLPAIAGFSLRKFLWKIIGSSSQSGRGGFAIDITGPWEH